MACGPGRLRPWLPWRAQIPLPPVDEKKKVIEDVDKDRRYAIDAAIVRTMKSRKVLQHQQVRLGDVKRVLAAFTFPLEQTHQEHGLCALC